MSDLKIQEVTDIIRDSGGKVVGRTRLQKIAFLLSATDLDDSFGFVYKHYGPYSEQLASSAELATLFGELEETQKKTAWGGTYSIYKIADVDDLDKSSNRHKFASVAAKADSIALELAATAVFLSHDFDDPWAETVERKPEKSTPDRITAAKELLAELAKVEVPTSLPELY